MTDREITESIPELSTPVYESLKDLHLEIPFVQNGRAVCAIVAPDIYSADAIILQLAIEDKTGIKIPIISDIAQLNEDGQNRKDIVHLRQCSGTQLVGRI